MKTILLPTDFSENSRNAILYALQLFKTETCHFKLLHVYKVNNYDISSRLTPIPAKNVLEKTRKEKCLQLKYLAEELKNNPLGRKHKIDFTSANAPLVAAVREEIKNQQTEVIVIGTHGHTGTSEVVYGSNTVHLMEDIQECPVLAVPAHEVFHSLNEIVFAHGFKAKLTPGDLNFLITFSLKFEAPIRILYIAGEDGLSEGQKENKKWLLEHLKERGAAHSYHSLEFLSIPLGIYSFTESRGSDMIALINKKHSFMENLLFDPLYRNLAPFSKVPVLILHQP